MTNPTGQISAPIQMRPDSEQRIPMSYEDYLEAVDTRAHAEWVNGEAIIFMPPSTRHQQIIGFLYRLIAEFVDLLQLGTVLIAPFEMKVSPTSNAREPDMLFVATAHLPRLTRQRLAGPADLVVEVISPESLHRDRADKFFEYQQAGVREYWLIDPRDGQQQVAVYALNAAGQYQPIAADAEGRIASTVLTGFWLRPAWLWQEPLPAPLPVLMQLPTVAEALRAALDAQ
ncbi:MAG: Uma2 family endonuclease [Chloroflexaceae bacterium]|nr:Uma2 family endonuclease [Chloroflexaceae bacterium]